MGSVDWNNWGKFGVDVDDLITNISDGEWKSVVDEDGDLVVHMGTSHHVVFGNMEGSCGECHANADITALVPQLLDVIENMNHHLQEMTELVVGTYTSRHYNVEDDLLDFLYEHGYLEDQRELERMNRND